MGTRQSRFFGLILLLLVAVAVGAAAYRLGVDGVGREAAVDRRLGPMPEPPGGLSESVGGTDAGPETASEPSGGLSESEAIERALTLLPEGTVPTESIARLVTSATASRWTGFSEDGVHLGSGYWAVGIRAPGLTQGDAARFFVGDMDFPSRADPIDAIAVVFDRRTGDLVSVGSLASGQEQTFEGLLALPTASAGQ